MIFFPSHPVYEYLSDQTKDKIMFTINRETQREKILVTNRLNIVRVFWKLKR